MQTRAAVRENMKKTCTNNKRMMEFRECRFRKESRTVSSRKLSNWHACSFMNFALAIIVCSMFSSVPSILPVDAVIIGAGCSGLSCAEHFASAGVGFCIVEEGLSPLERNRTDPFDAAAGVGGAGLFSDGKFSFWPSGQRLYQHVGAEGHNDLRLAFSDVVALLSSHGIPSVEFPARSDLVDYGQETWTFKPYPSFYEPIAAIRTNV